MRGPRTALTNNRPEHPRCVAGLQYRVASALTRPCLPRCMGPRRSRASGAQQPRCRAQRELPDRVASALTRPCLPRLCFS